MGQRGRLQINAILFTRDGRHFGNAIVTGHDPDSRFPWQFTTDYGNVVKEMSTSDIHKYFRVGSVADTDHKQPRSQLCIQPSHQATNSSLAQ